MSMEKRPSLLKNLVIVIMFVSFSSGLTILMCSFVRRAFSSTVTITDVAIAKECVDSAELMGGWSGNGSVACSSLEQKIEIYPVKSAGVLSSAEVLVKCICVRKGAK
jgi:hypothetical protein